MPISVRLPEEMEQRLDYLAKKTGRKKSFYVKEALMNYLEDLEDIYLAEKALEDLRLGKSYTVSFEDMKARNKGFKENCKEQSLRIAEADVQDKSLDDMLDTAHGDIEGWTIHF